MPNDFNVHSIVANEALYWFENELVMGNLCWRGYEKEWRTINGHKIGDTVSIDRPARFVSVDGPDITGVVQDVVYGKKDIKLNIQKTVPFQFDARGLTTEADIRRVGEESIRAAASRLAQDVETAISGIYWQFANVYGTPGTPATVTKVLGQGGAILTNLAVELPGRSAVVNPDMKVEFADQIKSLANTGKERAALERTKLGPLHNFDTYESPSLVTHTAGDWQGTVLVMGAGQASTYANVKDTWVQNLALDGFTTATAALKRGDVFTIAGCFEVNPGTLLSTGRLRRFTVQANVAAVASAATVSITPPIIPLTSSTAADKANATVTAAPADNAAITPIFGGTAQTVGVQYRQNLLFHRKALSLIMKPLQKLESFTVWEQRNRKGLSLTLSKGGDIYKHSEVWRLDILFGVDVLHTDLGLRLTD
jgi:hypothetical protein